MFGQLLGVLGDPSAPDAEEKASIIVYFMIVVGVVVFFFSICASYFLGIAGRYIKHCFNR